MNNYISLQQLKENYIESRVEEMTSDGFEQEDIQEAKDRLIEELSKVNSLKQMAPFFDFEWISSHDVHGFILNTLKHCVKENE